MSHFECRLNQRFWLSKKVVQVTTTAAFFRETVPNDKMIKNHHQVVKFSTFLRSVGALPSPLYAPRASAWQNTIFLTGDFVLCSMLLLMVILLLMLMLILPPFGRTQSF